MFGEAEWTFLELAARPLIIAAIVAVVLTLVLSLSKSERPYWGRLGSNVVPALGYAFPIVFVAFVAGYLTGLSRAAVLGSVVAAVLALIGGLNLYFLGTDNPNRGIIGASILVFTLMLLYGIEVGVVDREAARVTRLIQWSEQERQVRMWRQNRDLPAEPPAWLLTAEPK